MRNYFIVCGTRPEAIKLIPIYLELKKSSDNCVRFVSTGQHTTMLHQVLEFFDVTPDFELKVMQSNQSLSDLTAALCEKLDELFQVNNCDTIIVQGDTTTAFIASLIGFYHKIKVVHIEAGLRTSTKHLPFPEEMNRRLIGRIADVNFAPTETAYQTLVHEKASNVYNVGNTVIDSLFLCMKKVKQNQKGYDEKYKFLNEFKKAVLITCHRRESFGEGLLQICFAIKTLANQYPDFVFIYPVHFNPNVREVVFKELAHQKNVQLIDPVPYDELVYLIYRSYLIMTDSGGIQEEAPSLNKPVVVLREETERMEGVDAGCAVLVGTNTTKIIEAATNIIEQKELYIKMANVENPYGDGKAAKRIVAFLQNQN